MPISIPDGDWLFPAGSGYVLVRSDEKVALHNVQKREQVAEIGSNTKFVVWSKNNRRAALFGKNFIVMCTSKLEHFATVHETISVKSAA